MTRITSRKKSASHTMSLIAIKEPGMIGIMEPVFGEEMGIPAGLRMPGFLAVRKLRFGARWGEFRCPVRAAVQHQAVGVVA